MPEENIYKQFKKISISEFFERNRHLLGFDNPRRALLITVKELVDNALDACEESHILPDITIKITEKNKEEGIYEVEVEDNGPGIPYDEVPNIYGSFLYGSKFHRYVSTRGKQGIGASAITLYSQLTVGKPIEVISKQKDKQNAILYKIKIDINTNTPQIIDKKEIYINKESGVIVKVELKGEYFRGKQSVDEYIELTALANPHANITYINPLGEKKVYKRITNVVPELKEAKPHPHGIEYGVFERLIKNTKYNDVLTFLVKTFSSISKEKALKALQNSDIDPKENPKNIPDQKIEKLYKTLQKMKFRAIPAKYITIIGKENIIRSLEHLYKPDFQYAVTRKPAVYRGIPFIVEVGIAYGGKIEKFELYRFANRVPLLYKAGECATTVAAKNIQYKRYGLNAEEGELPKDPMILLIHVASVWLPFTSESKEAIAPYPEIVKEIELAIKDALRELSVYLNKVKSLENIGNKYKEIYGYGLEVARYLSEIINLNQDEIKNLIINRIKEELRNDIILLLRGSREIRSLIKENKYDLAKRSIISIIKPVIESKILTQKEIEEIIDNILEKIKNKTLKIEEQA